MHTLGIGEWFDRQQYQEHANTTKVVYNRTMKVERQGGRLPARAGRLEEAHSRYNVSNANGIHAEPGP